jgi:hypothetical protein
MKKAAYFLILVLILILILSCLTGCTARTEHRDPFYNYDDFSMNRIPLINPIEINRLDGAAPWDLELQPGMWVDYPNSQGLLYLYGHVHAPEKFAVDNGVIMAYSPYVDPAAGAFIQDHFYHWFVSIPADDLTEGFSTEAAFLAYCQDLGIAEPDWQAPDAAWEQFRKTGCLAWLPDCDALATRAPGRTAPAKSCPGNK